MLQINKPRLVPEQVPSAAEFISPAEIYAAIVGFLRRQLSVIIFGVFFTLALGAVYLFTAPVRYTAHAVLVIDSNQSKFFQAQMPYGNAPMDSAAVDTQIEIIKSQNIALSVIKDLHLDEDPEFISPRPGFLSGIIGLITNTLTGAITDLLTFGSSSGDKPANSPTPEFRLTQSALGTFQGHLAVKRVGVTYAIDIEFQSLSPDRAAQIANAVADAYVVDALEAKYQTTRRAAIWLQDRLKELREESANAEHAVIDYKSKNNIVDTGGRLMNEQQLAELNSQLMQARAAKTDANARLDRVQNILVVGDVDPTAAAAATVADTLHNEVITKLRGQYLEYDARLADWTAKYGAKHLAVINLRNQMQGIRRSIFQELQRIAETYKSDYEIAKSREEFIQKSLAQIITESQSTNQAQVKLHDLQSSAESYRSLYNNFLQHYMESVQQQSFPVSESRLIAQATRPLGKSSPKSQLILTTATLAGLIFGIGLGLLREISDRVFRTSAQVSGHLQADCISVVPLMKGGSKRSLPERPTGAAGSPAARLITRDQSLLWATTDSPLSRFAESIRSIKVAADIANAAKAIKVIGITSSLPNEGKSTIAMSIAELIAVSGARSLLVDCDLRNPSLSRKLTPKAEAGLLEVISGKAALGDVLWSEPTTKLTFLPAVLPSRLAHSSEILASAATRALFERLRETYDYVIVDLSPLAPVVDVRAMTHLIDSFAFVVEWGRTKIDVAEHALSGARGVYENLLGIVLNKADMNVFGRYESYRGSYYYNRYYARYGYTD